MWMLKYKTIQTIIIIYIFHIQCDKTKIAGNENFVIKILCVKCLLISTMIILIAWNIEKGIDGLGYNNHNQY